MIIDVPTSLGVRAFVGAVAQFAITFPHIRNESVILRFLETPRRTLPITLGHYVRNFSNANSPNKRRGSVGAGSFAKCPCTTFTLVYLL